MIPGKRGHSGFWGILYKSVETAYNTENVLEILHEEHVPEFFKNRGRSVQKALVSAGLIFTGLAVGLIISGVIERLPSSWEWAAGRPPIFKRAPVPSFRQPFVEISRAATDAVVNISTVRAEGGRGGAPKGFSLNPDFWRFFLEPFDETEPRPRREHALGSGVIVDPGGVIVTNHHVVAMAREIKVLLKDNRSYVARVIGMDPKTDLAVIKIDAEKLPTIQWGDSDQIEVGQYILAVGNPFGFSESVTMGIVSAVGRTNVGVAEYENFIQTDAAINPGNSGGALVDMDGKLVGINTAILSESGGYAGVGFAIPSNMARRVVLGLTKEGRVIRGWVGVTIQDLDSTLAEQFGAPDTNGALVSDIVLRSPADRGGIRRGDVIVAFNGKRVSSAREFRNAVADLPVRHAASLEVLRGSRKIALRIEIGASPEEASARSPQRERQQGPGSDSLLSGVKVHELSPELRRRLGLDSSISGVAVLEVEPGSRADAAGLRSGDILQEIDHHPILGLDSFNTLARQLRGEKSALLLVVRDGRSLFAALSR